MIATNWSGLTAFINEEVAYPLHIEGLVDTKPDGPNFFMWVVAVCSYKQELLLLTQL